MREAIVEVVDFLIMALDETEDDADLEPSLGAVENRTVQSGWSTGVDDDREVSILDEPHDEIGGEE